MQDIIIKKKEEGVEKIEVNKAPSDPNVLEWSVPEFTFNKKSNDWYWAVGIITLALVVLAYFLDNFFFAAIAIIGGFVVMLYGAKRPEMLEIKITEKGVNVNKTLFLTNDIDAFSINEDLPEEPRLFIKLKKGFSHFIVVPIIAGQEKKVSGFLKNFLNEAELSEPFALILFRFFGI